MTIIELQRHRHAWRKALDLPGRRPLGTYAQGRPLRRAFIETVGTAAVLAAAVASLALLHRHLGLG